MIDRPTLAFSMLLAHGRAKYHSFPDSKREGGEYYFDLITRPLGFAH
jgi:hypothetical protein